MLNKIIYGSIDKKIYSSDLLQERANKDFTGDIEQVMACDNYTRGKEIRNFIESNPGLVNSHLFYDMTIKEQMKDLMRKSKLAYQLGRDKWFINHEPHMYHWS